MRRESLSLGLRTVGFDPWTVDRQSSEWEPFAPLWAGAISDRLEGGLASELLAPDGRQPGAAVVPQRRRPVRVLPLAAEVLSVEQRGFMVPLLSAVTLVGMPLAEPTGEAGPWQIMLLVGLAAEGTKSGGISNEDP